MSETLIATVNSYETESQMPEAEDYLFETSHKNEIKDPSWGGSLYELVSANAHELVSCPWMGGATVTLAEAMTTYAYPSNMTVEDEPFVMSAVQELLTSSPKEPELEQDDEASEDKELDQIAEVEEQSETLEAEQIPPEEDKPQEDVNQKNDTKTEADKVQVETRDENKLAKQQAPVVGKVKNQPQPIDSKVTVVKPKEKPAPTNSQHSKRAPSISKADEAVKIDAKPAETAQPKIIDNTEIPTAATATPVVSAVAETTFSTVNQVPDSRQETSAVPVRESKVAAAVEIKPPHQVPAVEAREEEVPKLHAAEIKMPDTLPEFNERQEAEPFDTPVAPEIDTEPDPIEQLQLGIENAPTSNYAEPTDEIIEVPEEGLAEQSAGIQLGNIVLSDLVEKEIFVPEGGDDDDSGVEVQPAIIPSSEQPHLQKEEVEGDVEALVLDTSQIEEIENVLVQLAEKIGENDSEEADTVHKILVKITEAATKLEAQAGEDAAETEAQEELKELVIELLEKAGIEYAPELVEPIASLSLFRHLAKEIKKSNGEIEVNKTPQDTGTHESIMQLLMGSSNIKKIIERASAIGKSALRLSFKFT